MLGIETTRDTEDLCKLFERNLPKSILDLPNILPQVIGELGNYPYADFNLIKLHFELIVLSNELLEIKDQRLKNKSTLSKDDWLDKIDKHLILNTEFNDKYNVVDVYQSHWFWGTRREWKERNLGDEDPISGEIYGEIYADRPMSNFELWYEFGVCPNCFSKKTEKSDGINMVGICLSCNQRCDYDKNHRYILDAPDLKRPKRQSRQSKLIGYAKINNWI